MPTAAELIERAKTQNPILARQVVIAEQERRLSNETISRLNDVGVPRVIQPKRWGGYEMEPGVFAEIQLALGQGDLSAAWIAGVYAGHGYHVALFDERVQREVWSENEAALIASPYTPDGKAPPVAGGFRFSGRWQFSSGCIHSDWLLLGGVSTEDPTNARVFLLPRKDYEIIDTWAVLAWKQPAATTSGSKTPSCRNTALITFAMVSWAATQVMRSTTYRFTKYRSCRSFFAT